MIVALIVALVVALVTSGFFAWRMEPGWRRFTVLAILLLLAPLLVAVEGLATNCFFGPGGERCFGVGFAMVLAWMYGVPACCVLVGTGVAIARWWARRA